MSANAGTANGHGAISLADTVAPVGGTVRIGVAPGATGPDEPPIIERKALMRRVFHYGNRFMMAPLLKTGFGWLMFNPAAGYVMVLRTIGRKSGKIRYTPLNYAIMDGSVYCLAGFGKGTDWLANLQTNPRVEALLPGRAIAGDAEVVADPEEARRALVKVIRAAGFALIFEGMNPLTTNDEQLLRKIEGRPVVRIRPTGIGVGANDPGGMGWVVPTALQLGGLAWLIARIMRRRAR